MFSIAPQSVTLIVPGFDDQATLLFRNDADDVSRSILELTVLGVGRHILTFNTRGNLVEQQFVEAAHDIDEPKPAAEGPETGDLEPVPATATPLGSSAPDPGKVNTSKDLASA